MSFFAVRRRLIRSNRGLYQPRLHLTWPHPTPSSRTTRTVHWCSTCGAASAARTRALACRPTPAWLELLWTHRATPHAGPTGTLALTHRAMPLHAAWADTHGHVDGCSRAILSRTTCACLGLGMHADRCIRLLLRPAASCWSSGHFDFADVWTDHHGGCRGRR